MTQLPYLSVRVLDFPSPHETYYLNRTGHEIGPLLIIMSLLEVESEKNPCLSQER
jgi:hypothetical protein